MSLACTLPDGHKLTLLTFDGKLLAFTAEHAVAPGAPLRVCVDETGATLELKSIGSRRLAEGLFELRARITTMPKEVRDSLYVHFGITQKG